MPAPLFAEVVDMLQEIAPLELAAEWDNVGVLLQPSARPGRVARVLLTIDLTQDVVDEAAKLRCDLVVAYHPPIFRPLKRLDARDAGDRRLLAALQAGLAVYSPHTALDAAPGGLADWIVESLLAGEAPEEVRPVGEGEFGRLFKLSRAWPWARVLQQARRAFGVKDLQVGRPTGSARTVRTLAVAAGAGFGALRGVQADVLVTGEMSHHDVLATLASGSSVVLAGHSNTERGFLAVLRQRLKAEFGAGIRVEVSKRDRHPLQVG